MRALRNTKYQILMTDPLNRARKIKVVLFDVDGVLTDGSIWLFPAPASAPRSTDAHAEQHADKPGFAIISQNMIEAKGFNAHDGTAISLARLGGLKTGIVTKRISETVALRARDLRLDFVHQGVADKRGALDTICAAARCTHADVAFVGDDIIDLPAMRVCGLAIAVPNARDEVKRMAHYTTEHAGGYGAARDAIEYILRAQGTLEQVQEAYIDSRVVSK